MSGHRRLGGTELVYIENMIALVLILLKLLTHCQSLLILLLLVLWMNDFGTSDLLFLNPMLFINLAKLVYGDTPVRKATVESHSPLNQR